MYGVTNCLVRSTEAAQRRDVEELAALRARVRRLHEIAALGAPRELAGSAHGRIAGLTRSHRQT